MRLWLLVIWAQMRRMGDALGSGLHVQSLCLQTVGEDLPRALPALPYSLCPVRWQQHPYMPVLVAPCLGDLLSEQSSGMHP